jgi:hypothetical protein
VGEARAGPAQRSAFSRLLSRPGLAAQDGALPIGWPAAGRACRNVDGLAEVGQVANDALEFGDQGDEFHAPVAAWAFQNVLVERSFEKLSPHAHTRYTDLLSEDGSAADGSSSWAMGSGCDLMRLRHALAGASTPAYFTV